MAQLIKVRSNSRYKKFKNLKIVDDPVETFKKRDPPKISSFEKIKEIEFFSNNSVGVIFKDVDITSVDAYISTYFSNPCNKHVKIFIEDIHLIKKDFDSLNSGEWVNDQIINAYFRLLAGKCLNMQSVSTFFMTKIDQCGVQLSYLTLKNLAIFSFEYTLIPVFYKPNHWSLMIFKRDEAEIIFIDSLGKNGDNYMQKLKSYLRYVCYAEKREEVEIKLKHETGPQQTNGYDCGVFTMASGRSFCINGKISSTSFKSSHMGHVRRIIKFELLKRELHFYPNSLV